jgi:hypothetical protein
MRALRLSVVVVLLTAMTASACGRSNPPAPPGIDAAVSPLPTPVTSTSIKAADGATESDAGATTKAPLTATVDAGDPGALPQTRDKPELDRAALDARSLALWDGIVRDDPDAAMPFFFPVTAYEQVKAIVSPASDWRRRLVAAYKRDIHGLHQRLGDKAANAKFVRLDIPDERARWVEPNEESNKLGYYRVYGTRIAYSVDGKERTLDISSLISWRGSWYVVHLTGFK